MEKPTTLVFGNNYGLEFTATVMENRYDRFTVFSLDFLGVAAVRGITAVMTGNRILLITQMRIHLTFKHVLQYPRVGASETCSHHYLYSLKIFFLIVMRNSTQILYPGIVQRVFWLLPSGFAATSPEP